MNDLTRILVVFLLVLGNAVFVAAEYALVAARRSRLEEKAREAHRSARTALALMDDPGRFISTVQVGITIFSIMIGAIGEPLVAHFFDGLLSRTVSFVIAFSILTYLSVVLGELVPKAMALHKAEALAMVLAVPLDVLARALHPVVWLLQQSAVGVGRLIGVRAVSAGVLVHTREDVFRTVAEAEDTGLIEQAEEEMLYKVFDFADKEVSDVIVPRPQVVALSVDLPPAECLAAVLDSPYTRYPVYRGTVDSIVGILHVRDLFHALVDRGIEEVSVESLLRPVYVVPETKDIAALLTEFRRTNQHMAVVVDEYGAVQGIVTLEDVLEELVGEIEDEFDLPDESVERIDDRTIRVDGTFPIDDFNEQFGTSIPPEDFHTLAGFVFGALGRAPVEGDEADHDGLRFLVLEVEGTRIERLQVEFAGAAGGGTQDEDAHAEPRTASA